MNPSFTSPEAQLDHLDQTQAGTNRLIKYAAWRESLGAFDRLKDDFSKTREMDVVASFGRFMGERLPLDVTPDDFVTTALSSIGELTKADTEDTNTDLVDVFSDNGLRGLSKDEYDTMFSAIPELATVAFDGNFAAEVQERVDVLLQSARPESK